MESEDFKIINVGRARSIAELAFNIGDFLKEYTEDFKKGMQTNFKWYLGNLIPGEINLPTITTFLSIANRIRNFKGSSTELIFEWRPKVFTILHDFGFFEVSKELDIFHWNELMVQDYKKNLLNPDTLITYFNDSPPPKTDIIVWKKWKDKKRQNLYDELYELVYPIFNPPKQQYLFDEELMDTIIWGAAELSLNSILHGKEYAFASFQRTSKRISVCICDSGTGFKNSIENSYSNYKKLNYDSEGILIGSLINKREIGLFEAIQEVTMKKGWIEINSGKGEICWRIKNWNLAKESRVIEKGFDGIENVLGERISEKTYEHKQNGYWRELSRDLRGTRINFEIPVL